MNKVEQIIIQHDNDAIDIMEMVNECLKKIKLNLQFVDDGKEHDGFLVYTLEEK